ncbi:hypothetical protein PISMIDRAFT_690996 [Pisolithus microcarpus 441]|uniref:Unplaced genomic scaffold scaffold_969, whole genome shotgun sequence n=1 Tax=Pisolithus microcarpus 441 TaxID=765257 RepID=A0A0C9YJF5_9AGAM|nr:hypothetical protein PISMIDRAFT_690996 [Pisolithus microcarpus 441]
MRLGVQLNVCALECEEIARFKYFKGEPPARISHVAPVRPSSSDVPQLVSVVAYLNSIKD